MCQTHYKRWQVHGDPNKGRKYEGISKELYKTWYTMLQRCNNPKVRGYQYYGHRGIRVCDRWRESYIDFIGDMGKRPTPEHTLDRINNDGNYEPSNCRWATRKEQNLNTSRVHTLTHKGITKSITLWAEELGMPRNTIYRRIRAGWDTDNALSKKRNSLYMRKS